MALQNNVQLTIPRDNLDQNQRNSSVLPRVEALDCSQRAQWLRAAVLGANDGVVSIASLMTGVGGVRDDGKAMILTFFAGLFASACSLAVGEFLSMLDTDMIAQMERERRSPEFNVEHVVAEKLPYPFQATSASFLVFSLVSFLPLFGAAFITNYSVGPVVVVVAATTMALVVLGGIAAALGRIQVAWCCGRMAVGGWVAMTITFGVAKLVGASGLEM